MKKKTNYRKKAIRLLKAEKKLYTYQELSAQLDCHITTIRRWIVTEKINTVYAKYVIDKLQ